MDELISHYPSLLVFSVDSVNSREHDESRCFQGLYERVCESIKYIKGKSKYPVAIRTVITKRNYMQLPEIIKHFTLLGVDCIKLTHIEDDYKEDYLLTEHDQMILEKTVKPHILHILEQVSNPETKTYAENRRKVNMLFKREGVSVTDYAKSNFAPNMVNNKRCDLITRFITIQSNGDYLPCCEAEHHGWPILGNIKSDKLKDVLTSIEYMKILQKRQEYCIRCTEWDNFQLNIENTCRKVNTR